MLLQDGRNKARKPVHDNAMQPFLSAACVLVVLQDFPDLEVANLHLPPYDVKREGDSLGCQSCDGPKGHADEDGQPVGTVMLLLGSKVRALSIPVQPGMCQAICLGILLLEALIDIKFEAGIGQNASKGGAQAPVQTQKALLLNGGD